MNFLRWGRCFVRMRRLLGRDELLYVRKLNTMQPRAFTKEILLSKDTRERCMATLKSSRALRVDERDSPKKAAVLVPLCLVKDQVCLLYTLRSSDLRNYRGQVSFPGGMQDDTDVDLEDTVLRETQEELGLERSQIQIWGPGNYVGTAQRNALVLPFVAFIGEVDVSELQLNPSEVESAFTVPVSHLCDPANFRYTRFRNSYTLPVFTGALHKIWGVTAIITHLVLGALQPKTYPHRIPMQVIRPLNVQ